ncbi:hypothetical protein R3P38DRAFT_2576557 [Favolaschia claudopus]|uniref:Uncharacterized protein n=1 Tax=Favolaschia claudopus TaxID=2862362 RepID=A0AAV9ZJ38_9AGAR
MPAEVILPPKQLEKIVSSAGTFLSQALVEPKHILKVVQWDMAPADDVSQVCDVIMRWRLTLDIVRTPPSARRARKQPRSSVPPPPLAPFTLPLTQQNPSTPRSDAIRGRGGSIRGRRGTPRANISHQTALAQTPLAQVQHNFNQNSFATPTYDDFFSTHCEDAGT